jgi:hypothetical protein
VPRGRNSPCDARCFGDASAAVVAQVENEALHSAFLETIERGMQVIGNAFADERRHTRVPGCRIDHRRDGNRRRFIDRFALHGALEARERTVRAPSLEGERHRRTLLACKRDVQLLSAGRRDRYSLSRN